MRYYVAATRFLARMRTLAAPALVTPLSTHLLPNPSGQVLRDGGPLLGAIPAHQDHYGVVFLHSEPPWVVGQRTTKVVVQSGEAQPHASPLAMREPRAEQLRRICAEQGWLEGGCDCVTCARE